MNHTIATNATSESARAGASTASIARVRRGDRDGLCNTASRAGREASSSPAPQVPAKTRADGDRGTAHGQRRDQRDQAEDGQRERECALACLARRPWSQVACGALTARASWRRRWRARRAGARGRRWPVDREPLPELAEPFAEPLSEPLAEALRERGDVFFLAAVSCPPRPASRTSWWAPRARAARSRRPGRGLRCCGRDDALLREPAAAALVRAQRRGIRRSSASANPAAPSSTRAAAPTPRRGLEPPVAVACSALLTCSTSTRFLTGTLFVTCRFLNQLMNATRSGW